MLEMALERLGTPRAGTVMIGDQIATDILAGQKAGLRSIRVTTGVPADDLRALAEALVAADRAVVLTARGAEQHSTGSDTVLAWIDLALALGLPGRPASGWGCLTGQGNGQGGRWREHRQVSNAILWKLRTGASWRDLPERYGPWKPAHERLRRWTADGTWEWILNHVIVKDDPVGAVEWIVSVDSSSVRAHQHAAGARKKGAAPPGGSTTSPSTVKPSAGPAAG